MLLIITLTHKSIYVTDTHTLAYTALSLWYKAIALQATYIHSTETLPQANKLR